MSKRTQLTLPGAIALALVAAALLYLDERGEPDTASTGPSQTTDRNSGERESAARPTSPAETADAPGNFDYYALALSWSPTHCASEDGRRDSEQCAPRHGRPYGFILHGLWPQYAEGYPESCPTEGRPFVPNSVIDGMADIMPSRGLVIHQYRKHGTCSGLAPKAYFDTARRLFRSVRVPERFRNPTGAQFVSPGDVINAFVAANPKLDASMMAVVCAGPGNRFREIRICFSKSGQPIRCGRNETQGRLCRTQRMHVPPVRLSRGN